MSCYYCDSQLIWGGDHDLEDNEDFSMVTNLTCSECPTYIEVYCPRETGE